MGHVVNRAICAIFFMAPTLIGLESNLVAESGPCCDMSGMFHSLCGQQKWVPHALLLSVQMCFSGYHIVATMSLKQGADSLIFALYREIMACICMYAYVRYRNVSLEIMKDDYVRFIILGFLSFVNVVGSLIALQYISAARFALFQPCIPCIATFVSIFVGLERFTWLKAFGIALAVVGAIVVEAWKTGSSGAVEQNVTLGTIIVAIQCTGMACLIVFQKPFISKYDASVLTFTYYSIGALFTLALCICWVTRFTTESLYFSGLTLPWLALTYAAVVATLFPYNVYSYVGRVLSPSITTIYSTFQPIGTVILSLLILGYAVTLSEGIGGLIVVLGLFLTVYAKHLESSEEEEFASSSSSSDLLNNRKQRLLSGDCADFQVHSSLSWPPRSHVPFSNPKFFPPPVPADIILSNASSPVSAVAGEKCRRVLRGAGGTRQQYQSVKRDLDNDDDDDDDDDDDNCGYGDEEALCGDDDRKSNHKHRSQVVNVDSDCDTEDADKPTAQGHFAVKKQQQHQQHHQSLLPVSQAHVQNQSHRQERANDSGDYDDEARSQLLPPHNSNSDRFERLSRQTDNTDQTDVETWSYEHSDA